MTVTPPTPDEEVSAWMESLGFVWRRPADVGPSAWCQMLGADSTCILYPPEAKFFYDLVLAQRREAAEAAVNMHLDRLTGALPHYGLTEDAQNLVLTWISNTRWSLTAPESKDAQSTDGD